MCKIYAVAVGRETGVFNSWSEVKPLVEGVSGAKYKSFPQDEKSLALAFAENKKIELPDSKSAFSMFCHIQECTLGFYNKAMRPKSINDIGGFVAFFVNADKVGGFKYNKRIANQFEAWAYAIHQAVQYAINASTNEQLIVFTSSTSSFTTASKNTKANNWIKKAKKLAKEHNRKLDVQYINKTHNPSAFYFNEGLWRK